MNETDIREHQASLLTKCISLRRNFRVKRTDEALQQLREAENERYRFHYLHNTEAEKERTTKWHTEHSEITVTCEVCNSKVTKSKF